MNTKFEHVMFAARDAQALANWLVNTFPGLRISRVFSQPTGDAIYIGDERGNCFVELVSNPDAPQYSLSDHSKGHLAFTVEDNLDHIRAKMQQNGVQVGEIIELGGNRFLNIRDSNEGEGVCIQLVQRSAPIVVPACG